MTKKNLKINSLSRYSKQSSRLILEEHGHCEVPAGCGGVVLRWNNPHHQSIPFRMIFHTYGEIEFLLDGKQPSSSQPFLSYGEHVLALHISQSLTSQLQSKHGLLMFAGFYDESKMDVNAKKQKSIYVLSAPDTTWKYSLSKPTDDSWQNSEFDDSDWIPMELKSLPEPDKNEMGYYRFGELKQLGAQGLGVKNVHVGEPVVIRKSFTLSQEVED